MYPQLVCLVVLTMLVEPGLQSVECTYNPQTFSVTASQPTNPITNCLEYCRQFHSETPQRAYYNISSQECEPIRVCKYQGNYYNYATNRCYTDGQFKVENESYIPPTTLGHPITLISKSVQMVCVNGQFTLLKLGQPAICMCKLLWESSGRLDMNGFPFYCDRVTQNPDRHFYKSLSYDTNLNIVKYGPFTADQMQVILANMRSFERFQVSSYALNQTEPILYAVYSDTPQEPLLRTAEYPLLIAALLALLVVFGISYFEYEELKIRLSEPKLKRVIVEVLNQPNLNYNANQLCSA